MLGKVDGQLGIFNALVKNEIWCKLEGENYF